MLPRLLSIFLFFCALPICAHARPTVQVGDEILVINGWSVGERLPAGVYTVVRLGRGERFSVQNRDAASWGIPLKAYSVAPEDRWLPMVKSLVLSGVKIKVGDNVFWGERFLKVHAIGRGPEGKGVLLSPYDRQLGREYPRFVWLSDIEPSVRSCEVDGTTISVGDKIFETDKRKEHVVRALGRDGRVLINERVVIPPQPPFRAYEVIAERTLLSDQYEFSAEGSSCAQYVQKE